MLPGRRGPRGFTLIEVLIMGGVLIGGALFMAQSMTSQQRGQSQQHTILTMRKILAEEVSRVLQSPDRFPILPVAGTAAIAGTGEGITQRYPMRMSYVACYTRDAAPVANRMGYIGYVAVRVDNMVAGDAAAGRNCGPPAPGHGGGGGGPLGGALGGGFGGISVVGGAVAECSIGASVKEEVRDSGQCDPAQAQYEAQISPGSSGGTEYSVLVRPLWTEQQIARKGGLLRRYVKQSVAVSTGR